MARRYLPQIPNAQPGSTYFGPTLESLALHNFGAITPSSTPTQNGFPLNIPRGEAQITASMSLDNVGGTMAAGDTVTFQILRDGTPLAPQAVAVAVTSGGTVSAFVSLSVVDFTTVGSHTYSARATIGNSHTAEVPAGQSILTVIPL